MTPTATITPQELQKRQKEDSTIDLIDVRTPVEFRAVHAQEAQNVPLDRLDPADVMQTRRGRPDAPLYVICKGGMRAAKAQQKFQSAGFTNVVNVVGGTDDWVAAGLPVVRGQQGVSLERQVRIVAGAIVSVGALLAIVVHPFWAALPAVIGAGLVFAGVTDWCGMGLLLAKMPWNHTAGPGDTGSSPTCRIS